MMYSISSTFQWVMNVFQPGIDYMIFTIRRTLRINFNAIMILLDYLPEVEEHQGIK